MKFLQASKTGLAVALLSLLTASGLAVDLPVFSGLFQGGGTTPPVRAADIFRKNLGFANPVQWAKHLPGTADSVKFLNSPQWQNTKNDIFAAFGNHKNVRQYIDYQEYLFRKRIKINNINASESNKIKGRVAESFMDSFFQKDGWEPINGKIGVNGFDGLYVKRSHGKIVAWLPVEAKSGTAQLSMTKRGKQLSPGWIKGNLEDLLKIAEKTDNKQQIADIKQIMGLNSRIPRVFRSKIERISGRTYYTYKNLDRDGKLIGRPYKVNMQTEILAPMQRMIYKNFQKQFAIYLPKSKAESLTRKLQNAFQRGKIRSDSDLYRFAKNKIPDRHLAKAVAQELGEEPPRGSLAREQGMMRSNIYGGAAVNAAVIAGFIIAQDALRGNINPDTFKRAGIGFASGFVSTVVLNYGIEAAAKQLAKISLQNAGRKLTAKAIEKESAKLTSGVVGKVAGGTVIIAFAAYNVGKTIYNYDQGNITQTDMIVDVSITTATTAAIIILTWTGAGAELGAAIGSVVPGLGTAIGGALGIVVAAVGGIASISYHWYADNERQERLLYERCTRADWEKQYNQKRLNETIAKLRESAAGKEARAWNVLLAE